jgi:hypothetical protein
VGNVLGYWRPPFSAAAVKSSKVALLALIKPQTKK